MWLTSSSIGRKFVMALTGAFLVLFVTFHVLMNGVAIFWPTAYNAVCEFLGANWYALVGTLILAGGFLLHILYALWLTWQNRRARGTDRYEVTSRPKQVEWSSKNMLVLGIVIVCFLILHMWQFWAKMQLSEVLHLESDVPQAAGTLFLQQVFGNPWMCIIYIIAFVALWLHLTHGIWSMCQSSGCDNGVWFNRLKTFSNAWATIVCALFIIEAIVFTVNAKNDNYLKCPALQEQYVEMALESENDYPMEILNGFWSFCDEDDCCEEMMMCEEMEGCTGATCAHEAACSEADCADCTACGEDCAAAQCEGCNHQCAGCPAEEVVAVETTSVNVQEFTNN